MTPAIEVRDLTKVYSQRRRGRRRGEKAKGRSEIRAVDGVDLDIAAGEILALVGESGSGKTTLGKMITRIEKPTSGSVLVGGIDLARASRRELTVARRDLQVIFQDPYDSLDPRFTVAMTVEEPLRSLTSMTRSQRAARVIEILEMVELTPADEYAHRHPHQLSGGERQRVAIARALAVKPRCVVADEPVSMLDVSIRAAVLELVKRLQREMGVTLLFVTHDLAVARHLAQRIAVMQRGKIVEVGPADRIIEAPTHPYTKALLASVDALSLEHVGAPPES
jgi:peptide/nickel transport system ATP-binding protein